MPARPDHEKDVSTKDDRICCKFKIKHQILFQEFCVEGLNMKVRRSLNPKFKKSKPRNAISSLIKPQTLNPKPLNPKPLNPEPKSPKP